MNRKFWLVGLIAALLVSLPTCKSQRVIYPPAPKPPVVNPKPVPVPVPTPPTPPVIVTPPVGTLPVARFEAIQNDMTESQVIAMVGNPKTVTNADQFGYYYWHYKTIVLNHIKDVEIKFLSGRVTNVIAGF